MMASSGAALSFPFPFPCFTRPVVSTLLESGAVARWLCVDLMVASLARHCAAHLCASCGDTTPSQAVTGAEATMCEPDCSCKRLERKTHASKASIKSSARPAALRQQQMCVLCVSHISC